MSDPYHRQTPHESDPAVMFAVALLSMIAFVVVFAVVVAAWWS